MQEFEDFLASITYPPNPFRNFDNTLPTNVPLPGHFTTGRFAPAGQPLPNGSALGGMSLFRTRPGLDIAQFACVTCHTLPTGAGVDMRWSGTQWLPIAPGSMGQHHLAMTAQTGTTNASAKNPHLRNMHEKSGFNATQPRNTAGFGYLHDGSVDSIERFLAEPIFRVTSDQSVADLTAFMLAFSGSDLLPGQEFDSTLPPGIASKDTRAAVGRQTTVLSAATADTALINAMIAQANLNRVGLIVKGRIAGRQRGYSYVGAGAFQPDRAGPTLTNAALLALASPGGGELTYTVVPFGSHTRMGIDRDRDGWLDGDETAVCSDAADTEIHPGAARSIDVNGDLTVSVQDLFDFLALWFADAADFNGDGQTSVQDVFDFLARWFGGCA